MNWLIIDPIIKNALNEDVSAGDISTISTVGKDSICLVDLIAKEDGLLAGLEIFERVFKLIGCVQISFLKKDGDTVTAGTLIAKIKGSTQNILSGERVALNFLQRMSGIATLTQKYADKLKGTDTKLLDTRKTTPGLRILEKYSVLVGGGCNHRFNLSDGVMLKDNHIAAAGGIKDAVLKAKSRNSFVRKIEVETETISMVLEALDAGADIIMLDNMSLADMTASVNLINGRALTEASGNVSLSTINSIAKTGVDYISVGALTHSYNSLDLSMKNLRII